MDDVKNVTGKRWIYLDAYVLESEEAETLLQYFADHHQKMILCVESAMELQHLKTLPAFDYLYDVVYENHIDAILMDLKKHKRKANDALIIAQHDHCRDTVSNIGIEDHYGNLANFLLAKRKTDMTRYSKLMGVNIFMLILLGIPFIFEMNKQTAGCMMLCACVIFILNFCYGVSKGVFSISTLFEIIID